MEVAVWQKVSAKGNSVHEYESFSEPWVNPNAQAEAPKQDMPKGPMPSNDLPF